MELYLIRHAEAAPLGEGNITKDEDRPLTRKGEEQARRLASGFHAKGIHLSMVLTSPLLRARQTAEGMLQQWPDRPPELRVCQDLAPGGKRRKLSRFLMELACEQVGLVGHQPDLNQYGAWLIGSKRAQLDIAKAGVGYVICDEKLTKGSSRLAWLVPPEWFGTGLPDQR